jgi:hypothetical protein
MKADPMRQLITLGLLLATISLLPGLAENRKTEWAAGHGYTKVTDVVAAPSIAPLSAYTKVTAKFRK